MRCAVNGVAHRINDVVALCNEVCRVNCIIFLAADGHSSEHCDECDRCKCFTHNNYLFRVDRFVKVMAINSMTFVIICNMKYGKHMEVRGYGKQIMSIGIRSGSGDIIVMRDKSGENQIFSTDAYLLQFIT